MAFNDKFILEISAQLKNNGDELVKNLKTAIEKIENSTKIELEFNQEKTKEYIEKLKVSLNEVSEAMKNNKIAENTAAFTKFETILKQSAEYSNQIAKSLKEACKYTQNINQFNDAIVTSKNKAKLIKDDKDLTPTEVDNRKRLKSTRDEYSSILKSMYNDTNDIPYKLKNNVDSTIKYLEQEFSKLNIDISNTESVNKEIDLIKNNVTELVIELDKVNLDSLTNKLEKNLSQQVEYETRINKYSKKIADETVSKKPFAEIINSNVNSVNEYKRDLFNLKEEEKELKILIEQYTEYGNIKNKVNKNIEELGLNKKLKSSERKLNESILNRNAKLDSNYAEFSSFSPNQILMDDKTSQYAAKVELLNNYLKEYKVLIDDAKNSNNKAFDTTELTEYQMKIEEIVNELSDKKYKNAVMQLGENASFEDATKEMEKLIKTQDGFIKSSYRLDNSKMDSGIKKATASFRTADKQIKNVTYTFDNSSKTISKVTDSFRNIKLGSEFDNFTGKVKKKFQELSTYLLSFASFYEVLNQLRKGFSIIRELDTELTEMQKVSDESLSSLQNYAQTTFDTANKIGTTASQLQSSTADWMRLGKSLKDASKLAQDTNILMNVSEFESIDKATEAMVSMTQAYQELDSMEIIDKLNLTGNNYSISTNELAESLQRSSSALKTAKNSFDEAIALTVAGNSVVQDPDSVAAGIRTIALRMTGTDAAKKELEDMGEETDNVLTKSKLNDTLEMLTNIDERGGISLLDDNGNYRSTAKVLIELAERWQDIGEQDVKDGQNRQNALLEALAGKNRANILASILNDPNLIKDVYNDVSTNYQGSALRENEKQLASIEGHITQLKNKWQEFWSSTDNREFINGILDAVNGILDLINALGGAKVAIIALVGAWSQINFGALTLGFKSIVTILKEITQFGDSQTLKDGVNIAGDKIKEKLKLNKKSNSTDLTDVIDNSPNVISIDGYKKLKESGENVPKEISKGIEDGKEVIKKSTNKAVKEGAEEGAKLGSVEASNGGLMNIAKFLFTTPVGLAITTIGAAFIAKSIYDSYIKGLEEASNRVESSLSSFNTKKTELNQFKESIPDLAKEYDSLRKGVSYTGENLSLTNDEFQRYHEITSQIASTCPELISGYDSTGNAIVNLTNSLEDLNNAYDETLKKEAIKSLKEGSIDDAKKSIEKQELDSQKDYFNFVDNSGVNKFFKGGENSKKAGKILDKYQTFINDNSDNKKLKKITNKLSLRKKQDQAGGAGVRIASNYMALSKSLSFDSKEYESTIKMLQEELASTTDEDSKQIINSLIEYLQNTVTDFKNEFDQMKDKMITKIQTNDKYYDLDMNKRNVFDSFVQNLNEEDYYKYEGNKIENLFNKYYEYVKGSYGSENVSTLSNWQSLLTGSNGTIAENEKKIQEAKNSLIKGLGLSEETVDNKFNIDTTILNKEKEKLVKFYSDVNSEAEKSEDKTNGNIVKKYKQSAKEKEKIIKGINKNLSGKELTNIANNIDSIDIDKVLNEYESKYKKLYKNRDEFISDYLDSFKNVEISYKGQNKSFNELETNVSNYSSALAQLNTIGNDNVVVNSELAQTLTSMGDGFKEYIQWSEDGSTATITNTQAVKDLVKAEQEKASIDARNSKNQAVQNYKNTTNTLVDLTNQLEKTADSEGNLDQSILSTIQSTESQLDVLKRNIQYYEQLETKILGATNAFDAYNLAVQQDESQNTYSTATSMVDTLKNGFETGRLGTEAFKASIQGLLSDSSYREIMDIDNLDARYNKMKEKYNELKQYFKTDSNGNPSISGIKNFVNDSYSKGLLTSNNLSDFQIKEGKTIDDFVEKLGYSKETIYAMAEVIKSFDFNWGQSFFDGLTETDTFGKSSKDIEDYTDKIRENTIAYKDLLIQRSKLDKSKNKEKWDELTNQINKYSSAIVNNQKLQNKAYNDNAKNVMSYIEVNKQISEQQSEVDILNKKLKEYKTAYTTNSKINGKTITKKDIEKLELDTKEAEEKLGNLLNKKSKLGEPTEVNLTLAKEKFEKDLEELKNQKKEIESEIKTDLSNATIFKGENLLTGGLTLDIDKKNLLEETNNEINKVESNIKQIELQLGIKTNDGYDKATKEIKADIKEIGKGATVKVKADSKSFNATNKQLDKVKQKQDKIKQYLDVVTRHTVIEQTIKQNGGAKAAKTAVIKDSLNDNAFKPVWASFAFGKNNSKSVFNYFGKAYANGKLGNISSHTSGNTLVGELGAETIVDPWNGTYKVVGIHGAEFVNVPRDAIVFNHQQTRELQKTGKIKSRGAIVSNASGYMQGFAKASPNSGKAYGDGSNIRYGTKTNTGKSSKSSGSKSSDSKSSDSKSSDSNSDSNSKETKSLLDNLFDWIEIKLQRISDKTQKYMTLAENAISKTVKEAEYKYAISSTKSEINNNQAASKKYKSYANSLITKAKKNGVSKASAYAKKVRDGSISLQSISNEKILDFVNSYKEMYDKAKECDSAVLSLSAQLSDLAESFYNIPTEYAEKKIEKFSDEMDVLSAKLDITKTYQNKNKILDKQTSIQKNIMKAYNSASKTTNSNFTSAKRKIDSTKDRAFKGLNSKQKKAIIAKVKSGEEVHISPKYSATLQSAIANYNKALEANRIAYNNAQKASAEYTKALRDNTKAKYDNITAYYDGRKGIDNSHISKNDAILEYRTAMGYSNTSDAQKSVIENKIKYEKERLGFINEELKTYDPTKLKKDYNSGKLSKDDYYSMLQHRQELEEEYYSTKTSLKNLNDEIKNLKITHLDYIIDGISSALEKFKNYITLKEIRGDKATETDYTDQIKYEENQIDILYQKYKELENEKASYAVESEEYKRVTEEQASIANEALQARQNIDDIRKSVNEIRFKPLEDANASLERQIDDFEHLKDILSKDELIDDNGNFTDSGLASIALIGKQMESSKTLIVNYRNGLEKLTESYKNGNLTLDEYNEQSQAYIKSIQDAVSAVDNYRDALIDMYKQQLEAENDTLQKTIDKRKEALEAKKRCVKMPVFI